MNSEIVDTGFRAEIPYEEWERVNKLRNILADDERSTLGRIHLSSDGDRRTWQVTDSYRAVRYRGGADKGTYSVSLSPIITAYASICAVRDGDTVLERYTTQDGNVKVHLTGAGGSLAFDELLGEAPDISEMFVPASVYATARANINDLRYAWALASMPRVKPADEDDELDPSIYQFSVNNGQIGARALHPPVGVSESYVEAVTTGENVWVLVDAQLMKGFLDVIELLEIPLNDREAETRDFLLDFVVTASADGPIHVSGTDVDGIIMPLHSRAKRNQDHVRSVIRETFDAVAATLGEQGLFPLSRQEVPVFGRFDVLENPTWLQVFTVVLRGVESSHELLKELNDLNQHLSYAPLFHEVTEDGVGQIVTRIDLLAEALDPVELAAAVKRIVQVATDITPALAAFFGGEPLSDPAVERWQHYRSTVVEAELIPESPVAITGEAGVEPWPFPGPVWVITGWNPQGVSLGDERHEYINQKVAEDVIGNGGRYVLGAGRSADGEHVEPSIIAWKIDREFARAMGNRANQDAIFEIDADHVHLLSCNDDRMESWPRRTS